MTAKSEMAKSLGLLCLMTQLGFLASTQKTAQRTTWKTKGMNLLEGLTADDGVEQILPSGIQFTDRYYGHQLSDGQTSAILSEFSGELTLFISGSMYANGTLPLLTITTENYRTPYLEIWLDTVEYDVVVKYLGEYSLQRVTMKKVLPYWEWRSLLLQLNDTHVILKVDCGDAIVHSLRQKLILPSYNSKIIFGASTDGEDSFKGMLYQARLYLSIENALCSDNKDRHLQSDESSIILGSPFEDRILLLEQQITQLVVMVDMLKTENAGLTSRIAHLETCECRPSCVYNGSVVKEGGVWVPELCTICMCLEGRPSCKRRLDVPSCATPCISSPCYNNGECVDINISEQTDFSCHCQPPYDGSTCQIRRNPCSLPPDAGTCDDNIPRYFYDKHKQHCLPFNFTGCGGNPNNFVSEEDCVDVTMQGACCYRTYSTNVSDVATGSQKLVVDCKSMHFGKCQSLHRQPNGETESEVISFTPGMTCEEAGCLTAIGCTQDYNVGDTLKLGCQTCTCLTGGGISCRCDTMTVRKEVRDMTREELVRFQNAVTQLRAFGDVSIWEDYRDLYMKHSMHSNGGQFYLPWHRVFLRRLEQKLQEIDCNVVLPYIDFSTDVGSFKEAMIWQADYFGGNGGADGCVSDHPFGGPNPWQPCFMRNFNTSVKLPTAVELAIALASEDYSEMSLCLETYAAYVHNYIGGDMVTTSSPYDPVFYGIHAYIDMLYWSWQNRRDNKYKYPAVFGNIPMVPFNIPPVSVLDSEAICVTYALPSKGHPCNVTETLKPATRPGVQRGDQSPEVVNLNRYNQFGYDIEDSDLLLFNRYGFREDGYNLDGFDRLGYDSNGFNRYGKDRQGYDVYGFNVNGEDRNGNKDISNRYGEDGYDMNCLDRQGFSRLGRDKYGFDIRGHDKDGCNYMFFGPFSLIHSHVIMEALGRQAKGFLMSLHRTCDPLEPLPNTWYDQLWITSIKDVRNMIPTKTTSSQSLPSSKFCIEADPLLSPCACEISSSTCTTNPCLTETCPSYPEAVCHFSYCGDCKSTWYYNDMEIDCHSERDYCSPNPCKNGGQCIPSVWPDEQQLVTCICPPGYDGNLCQYLAVDICSLPLDTGTCDERETRWRFNYRSQICEEFIYTGCHGNANNFKTITACQNRCVIGACCYREPIFKKKVIGYNLQGYDRYGYSIAGLNIAGDRVTIETGTEIGRERFTHGGLDWQGYDREGYDLDGFDRFGYDRNGFDKEGFNATGYSRLGEYDGIIDYDEFGYDMDGFGRTGFSCLGQNRIGLNAYETTAAYTYMCRSMTMEKCQGLESDGQTEVVKFSFGKRCEEVKCGDMCGCTYNNKTYRIGETFTSGCQTCKCSVTGTISCQCDMPFMRKEVRDLTPQEMEKYQTAIRALQVREPGKTSNKWFEMASLYASHKPQAVGTDSFLPWNRYFLRLVERHLKDVDCSVMIPYYDWTVDAGKPVKSIIWAANMFGGDGMGLTGCVRYHPFKDYHPPYWSPCLRRQFNMSVHLPDSVHVQLAMNEPTYERFRIRMEVFTKLYQGFVGGHMSSDYAPYDPLYFSLMAYIDKLWSDWQMKYNDGLLRYPRSSLFIPMVPFKATPNDVMESKYQMCVTYVPITKGTNCNITEIRHYGYDEEGYDRHGFDHEGYDRQGYDVTGLGSDGRPDSRGIYTDLGYDRYGYGRDGYDSSGFDKFGFYVDSYNLDGYNAEGYDRNGYDRYGFDKKGYTSFGFHRNGSSKMDVVTSHVKIFDDYGYNKFGFDKFGFDREGFDIYGFDSRGFDRMNCDYYYLGPMYMLVKQYIDSRLKNLNNETLITIDRLCPDVSDLEKWQITTNWLDRNSQEAIIDMIDFGRNRDYSNTSMVANIWTPTPADERFCIRSQIYNDCAVGQTPVLCEEDLCKGRSCPGHPTAVCRTGNCGSCYHEWYDGATGNLLTCSGCTTADGLMRQEGERWQTSICDGCVCQDGMTVCEETICPSIYCQHPIQLRDQCCPTCDAGCDLNGQIFPTGSRFRPMEDACSVCDCLRGNVSCRAMPCEPLDDCQSSVTPDGECCPVCLDCGQHADGEQWNPSPCQSCTCNRGEVSCETITCAAPNCAHPFTPDGTCCPVCSDCYYEGNLYQDGRQLRRDECTVCTCIQGNVECQSPECAAVSCRNPITPPGECCPSCTNDCVYEDTVYKHGATFMPSYNMCLMCSCTNSLVRCRQATCPPNNLPCDRPIKKMGECCPSSCPRTTCEHEGREYADGQTWTPRSPCQRCDCRNGEVICRVRETCSLECTHGVITSGQCCSACSDCLYDGRVIGDGQKFIRGGEGETCQQCVCTQGNIECTISGRCPALPCGRPVTHRGHCCPACPVCEYQGRTYQYGDIVSRDKCMDCKCLDGQVQCEKQQCPARRCRKMKLGVDECCPDCDGCEFYNQLYNEGQRFKSPRDPCQTCVCQRGEVSCQSSEETCPPTDCTHPVQVRNQCCRRCDGCEYLRRKFKHGQKFSPPDGDTCRICSCQYGSVTCERMECPDLNCLQPVLPPGQCCPVCDTTCVMGAREYRDGEEFSDPRSDCSICRCLGGEITCSPKNCPVLTCNHPATIPNQCCSTCDFCSFDRRIFRSMQRFIHPNDTCQECLCQDGSVTCTNIECPALPCRDSMPMAGSCCPVCPKSCNYEGLTYADGQTFMGPSDNCKECLCRQGQVLCETSSCPRVNCRHPAEEQCCPMCDNCMYQGLLWRNGQRFKDERDPCIKCQCSNGNVECKHKECPQVTCSSPMMKDCCPVCSECKVGNQMFMNGQSFSNPRNPCETCACQDGTVTCKESMCPPTPCQYPIKDGCCRFCSGCFVNGRTYRDGEMFPSLQNRCEECRCNEGDVSCTPKACPPLTCSNPADGECCKECRNCNFNGQTIPHLARVPDPSDICNECECRSGNMNCYKKQCSNVICRSPVKRGCCQECTDCLRNGREYKNGQEFPDVSDKCLTCHCLNGNINCRQNDCPPVTCQNPVQGDCCLECSSCLHNGRTYSDGQRFEDNSSPCVQCVCRGGNVECSRKQCPLTTCSHPVQGQCCPECGRNCFYQNLIYQDGQEFERDCKTCTCTGGNVNCYPKYCPSAQCTHPITENCCSMCTDCIFENRRYDNGQTVPDFTDPCNECVCRDGSFTCTKKNCPAVNCKNPAVGQCCPECRNCDYNGKTLRHGYRFPDPADECSLCTCQMGNIVCEQKKCSLDANCEHPVVDNCGCKTCEQCEYRGQVYRHLETFDHESEKCLLCTCRRGTVDCRGRPCSASCTHSARDSDCCPECKDCLYEGKIHEDGSVFVSDVDPCQRCTCRRGNILTQAIQCPPVRCLNPVELPGECCPSCPVCTFLGQTYNDNTEFKHPADACQTCLCQGGRVNCNKEKCIVTCSHPRQDICCPTCDQCFYENKLYNNGETFKPNDCESCSCRDGNVLCTKETCLTLPCVITEKVPGKCCPECKGCTYKGTQYGTGASWILPENPCITCTCHGGLVTCMEMECYVPCNNPVPVPGQCCPVCPTCSYNGRDYNDGDVFSPNGDSCDTCNCEGGTLRCLRETCPNVANCPPEQLVPPENGDCCPTCAGFGTNCTRFDLGMIIKPRPEDPCFSCECTNDFNWLCMKDKCPPLSCPPDVQIKETGQCCSSCPSCFDETEGKYHKEGDQWLSADEPCVTCECIDGLIQCSTLQCPPLFCEIGEVIVDQPGSCCGECQPIKKAECFYIGRQYEHGAEWKVDDCTRCECTGGEVTCNSVHCLEAECGPNEVPSIKPGNCCPVCEQKPATCLVFGDPHYRTFDGTTLHFQGQCKYIMAADCEGDSFRVEIQHDNRGVIGDVSWAQNFTIYIAGLTIDLLQKHVVQVDGERVALPYLYEPHIQIELSGNTVLLNTDIGMRLLWNGDSYAELSVPGTMKRKLCGLCGNFNGFPQDDLRTKLGQITNSPALFGNSWKAKTQNKDSCQDAKDIDPCLEAGYRVRKIATTKCSVIKSKVFSRCHRAVSPEPFFASCVYDMCVCMENPNCLCDIVASYAHVCAKAGIKTQWRSNKLCAFDCPPDSGLMFDDCGPACPRTCENQGTPLANVTKNCFKPCVASCQCSADKVLHNGKCISPAECPNRLS